MAYVLPHCTPIFQVSIYIILSQKCLGDINPTRLTIVSKILHPTKLNIKQFSLKSYSVKCVRARYFDQQIPKVHM
jgi:hypothetical protein